MSIIISRDGRNARKLEQTVIEQEEYLQQFVHANPEALPLDELKDNLRLLVLAREFSTASGPIDALGVDADGDGEIHVIEAELTKNADRSGETTQARLSRSDLGRICSERVFVNSPMTFSRRFRNYRSAIGDQRCSSLKKFSINHSALDSPISTSANQKPLLAHCFLKGYDVQWIDSSRDIVLADNYDDIFPNRDEIRVRDSEMPSVSEVQSKRPEPVLHACPDLLRIH